MSSEKSPANASKSSRLFKRLGLTLTAGAVLTGFYSVYAMVLRPVVETPGLTNSGSNTKHEVWAPPPPPKGKEMAQRYLVSQPWAANAKYVIRTEEAFVYFEEWDSLDEDEAVRFTPFAMIWMQKGREPGEKPYTIISDSAYVRFANKFRLSSPNAGRVVGGALEGEVQIEGDKGLDLAGRNFIFNEKHMRVWSDYHVDFAYGPHNGNGRELQIDLIPDEVARANEKLAVKGFKNIRLRRNVEMNLEFRGGETGNLMAQNGEAEEDELEAPPFAADSNNQSPDAKPKNEPEPPTIVKVRSAGSFEYVVATDVATFEDEVRVYQPTEPGKFNSLQADLLRLYFEPKPEEAGGEIAKADTSQTPPDDDADPFAQPEKSAEPKEEDSFQSLDSHLTFRRLVAQGQDVILRSETNDLIAMMNRLDYDAKTRLAKMTSRKAVRVLQKQSELQCPRIDLLHKDGGDVSHVWARGEGWLQNLEEKTRKLAFAAQWKKELRKLPDPRTGLDLIELEGEALVRQPEERFGLAAEIIRLWLNDDEPTETSPASKITRRKVNANGQVVQTVAATDQENADEETDDSNSFGADRLNIKQLLALKNVAIVSPEMQGQSQRLEVWFEPAPVLPKSSPPTAEVKRSRENLQPAVKRVPAGTVSTASTQNGTPLPAQPASESTRIPLAPPPAPESESSGGSSSSRESRPVDDSPDEAEPKPAEPIEIHSELIQVKVLTSPEGNQSQVSEVWTKGNVQVHQTHEDGKPPLHMTGERLHVENRSRDDQVMTLWGSPAHVRDRGMHIEGREIFLDRQKNKSLVNGAGLLQLPVERSLDGTKLSEPKRLDVWWSESMTFDGLSAKFFGNVQAVMDNDGLSSNMRCEEMEVVLTERISFQESRNAGTGRETSAEVDLVHCKDGVEFDSYKYEESKLTEVRRGKFAEFTLNQTTGDTSGQGPGVIKVWRRGRGKRAGLTPNATVKANRALKSDDSEWEYMRIKFDGTSDGNLKQKFNTFKEQVEIIYGPVERSLTVIKPEKLTKGAGWMHCESLRITHHPPEENEATGHIDLLALGNVDLHGRLERGKFWGRADSISYDESKGLYTLRSQGRRKARIWRQTQEGGERSEVVAQLMNFIPARNILKLDQTTGLDGVN